MLPLISEGEKNVAVFNAFYRCSDLNFNEVYIDFSSA